MDIDSATCCSKPVHRSDPLRAHVRIRQVAQTFHVKVCYTTRATCSTEDHGLFTPRGKTLTENTFLPSVMTLRTFHKRCVVTTPICTDSGTPLEGLQIWKYLHHCAFWTLQLKKSTWFTENLCVAPTRNATDKEQAQEFTPSICMFEVCHENTRCT